MKMVLEFVWKRTVTYDGGCKVSPTVDLNPKRLDPLHSRD